MASGLSNRADPNQRFSSKVDRRVAPVLGTSGWKSAPLFEIDARMRQLRLELSTALARPTLANDELPHEMYYSQSTSGALLPRHLDERHEELKGRKGWTGASRRSLSWLLYLSDSQSGRTWNLDENGGQLRTFQQYGGGLVNARFGGAHETNLQIAWLSLDGKLHPVYLDSYKHGEPVCGLYIVQNEGEREWISRDFEVHGSRGEILQASLLPNYARGDVLLIEDPERWGRGEAPAGSRVEDITPIAGRLVMFDSVLLPHEVLAVKKGRRLALAGWMHEASPFMV